MKLKKEIEELKKYTSEVRKNNNVSIYKTVQHNFLTGQIGVILNDINDSKSFEVYVYVKEKDIIACPLLFKKFNDVVSATGYYEEVVSLIENNEPEYILNRCKIGI